MENIKFLLSKLQENPNEDTIIQLDKVAKEISHIFSEIKKLNTLEESKELFNFLQKIQETLGFLFFNDIILLPSQLKQFVRDCDRLDDPWLREHLFNKLKNNSYSLK